MFCLALYITFYILHHIQPYHNYERNRQITNTGRYLQRPAKS